VINETAHEQVDRRRYSVVNVRAQGVRPAAKSKNISPHASGSVHSYKFFQRKEGVERDLYIHELPSSFVIY
jgi:hypothetical protein